MERFLSRESEDVEEYKGIEKLKIGILGISSGVGTSFLTTSMGRYFANTRKYNPAVVELGNHSIFDSI